MKGLVFDIQKFALHDGPGIRTTVFLKGCGMRCLWCCNPESQRFKPTLRFVSERCTNCMKCLSSCNAAALYQKDGLLIINYATCTACGNCINECDQDALLIVGSTMSADDVLKEVFKDKAYFNHSGGGVTFSGGEPVEQLSFLLELLTKAKRAGLHTCVETAAYLPRDNYLDILPFVDLFCIDFKAEKSHYARLTGMGSGTVLSNLRMLHDKGAQIIVRCPIIPQLNDTEEHWREIASLSNELPHLKGIELLPYHEYGMHKYGQTGRKPFPIVSGTVQSGIALDWIRQIEAFGGINVFIDQP